MNIIQRYLTCPACLFFLLYIPAHAVDFQSLSEMTGPRDAVVVSDPNGRIVFSFNAETPLVPASTLKILTALTAFHYLGPDYRFRTEFYLDSESNLKIRGYGDPLLLSEIVDQIAVSLSRLLEGRRHPLGNIFVDSSYYDSTVVIPGVTDTSEPYDAPNGALCVNFNTVNFLTAGGGYASAEPQTPLLPMTLPRIKHTGLPRGRITLSHQQDELVLYAGRLFAYFLEQAGVTVNGTVLPGNVVSGDKLILRHFSPYALNEVVQKMMTYSNNFMANQMLIEAGIALAGGPGTLQKGVAAVGKYAEEVLHAKNLEIIEGSGISRKNRITAANLHKILLEFKSHRELLRNDGDDFYKTGTLRDVSTRIGFVGRDETTLYAYVILCNTPGNSATPIRDRLIKILAR